MLVSFRLAFKAILFQAIPANNMCIAPPEISGVDRLLAAWWTGQLLVSEWPGRTAEEGHSEGACSNSPSPERRVIPLVSGCILDHISPGYVGSGGTEYYSRDW